MQQNLAILIASVLLLSSSTAQAADALQPENTYGIIVGVLKWEKNALSGFSERNRKDQELHDLLVKRGVPKANLSLLLDEKATLANILDSLRKTAKRAKPNSTFLFYYAGHGSKLPGGGHCFCNYDCADKKPSLNLNQIDSILKSEFKGARVILMADCCHSGGLQFVAERLTKAGIPAASVSSAEACNVSSGNWTFTQAVIDSLRGENLIDANGDGTIQLGEMAAEVSAAMKFREMQKSGSSLTGVKADFQLGPIAKATSTPGTGKGGFRNGDYVLAPDKGRPRPARIVGFSDGKYAVEFYDYSDKRLAQLAATELKPIEYQRQKAGDEITVLWQNQPFKAKVVRVDGDFHFITYTGFDASWDEWVLSNRIVNGKVGQVPGVQVEWKGEWYPAEVLKTEKEKYYIRYIGYDESWNEWVGKERIRFLKK